MSTDQITIYHKKPRHVSNILLHVLLIAISVIYLAPLAWIMLVSLKTNAELQAHPFSIPQVFQWENYSYAWKKGLLGTALVNSVKVSGITLIVSMIMGSMAACVVGILCGNLPSVILIPLCFLAAAAAGAIWFLCGNAGYRQVVSDSAMGSSFSCWKVSTVTEPEISL